MKQELSLIDMMLLEIFMEEVELPTTFNCLFSVFRSKKMFFRSKTRNPEPALPKEPFFRANPTKPYHCNVLSGFYIIGYLHNGGFIMRLSDLHSRFF